MLKSAGLVTFCGAAALSVSCSSSGGEDMTGPFGVGDLPPDSNAQLVTGGGPGTGGTSGNTGGGGGIIPGGGNTSQCMPGPNEAGCTGEVYAGETLPVDIYIMFDVSCSMSCPVSTTGQRGQCCMDNGLPDDARIHPTREAVDQFLNDPGSVGFGVGIGYFGYMPLGGTVCEAGPYSDPAVPIGTLPDHAPTILESLNAELPTGETPTGSAIRGACNAATAWKEQNPGRNTVILLVTDGVPESGSDGCDPSVSDSANAAAQCLQDSGIQTYVLGIGLAFDNFDEIAQGGGTDHAYLVDGSRDSVLGALTDIRTAVDIPCELTIPEPPSGEPLNYNEVNVGVCNAAGQVVTTYYVETPDACDTAEGGWFYDDPNDPTSIVLCEATCDTVGVPGASLYYSVGCTTVVQPIE